MSQTIHGSGIFWEAYTGCCARNIPQLQSVRTAFWQVFTMFGEGLMLPSMGLSAPAHKYPASTLLRDVTAHWAYTATVDGTCRLLQAAEGLFADAIPKDESGIEEGVVVLMPLAFARGINPDP